MSTSNNSPEDQGTSESSGGKVRSEERIRKRPGRVPVSCAECRRLKVRCDRKIPCEGCVKRGCAGICPEGSLVVGKHNRLVLANTEELHDEIARLRTRLQQVEDELATERETAKCREKDRSPGLLANDYCPNDPRPLGFSLGKEQSRSGQLPEEKEEDENFIDAFGTLTIGSHGETKFFGKTARSEFLIHAQERFPHTDKPFPRLSRKLIEASISIPQCFLQSVASNDDIKGELVRALPPLSEAIRLCEVFIEHGKYMYLPIPREQLFDEVLAKVYQAGSPITDSPESLALLFIIFAWAIFADPTRPPFAHEADEFYIMTRVTLNLMPPWRHTTVLWVQTYAYMVQFIDMRDLGGSGMPWADTGLVVKLGQSIGLHLKSSRWKLDQETSKKRNRLWWQLFMLDTWLSFGLGRPPTIDLSSTECELPTDDDEQIDEDGNKQTGYHMWMLQYTVLLRTVIMRTAFGTKTPSYASIMDLDRMVREFHVPTYLRPICVGLKLEVVPITLYMQRWGVLSSKEGTLLHLHRGYFAQALQDMPEEPLKHKYGLSVIAAYRSAYRLIQLLSQLFGVIPDRMVRFNMVWSHALSGAIVMCLLVTRARASDITRSALEELDRVHGLFQKAADTSQMASYSLDVVHKLHRLAHDAVDNKQTQDPSVMPSAELDRLGGKTQLLSEDTSSNSDYHTNSHFHQEGMPQVFADQQLFQSFPQNVHPAVVQDIMGFQGFGDPVTLPATMYDTPLESPPQFLPNNIQASGGPSFGSDFPQYDLGSWPTENGSSGNSECSFESSPMVLDSMWQNFVEQLGCNWNSVN